MPELFLELFSEEIPARMQAQAAQDLSRLIAAALAPLSPTDIQTRFGPRRIALAATVASAVAASTTIERGPRTNAPDQALAGFLRKHGAEREHLKAEGEYWVLTKSSPAVDAATLIAGAMPALLRRFPWPKSMRWGTSAFTWVRPLRRIVCVLDGEIVPFSLAEGADDGHGLAAGNLTEGHRFLAPAAFPVSGLADWTHGLRQHHVIADQDERRRLIAEGVATIAAHHGLTVVPDDGLIDEVTGLVEYPVPLIGRIDAAFMDLPPEVMQVSMRVNQRYFALRTAAGDPAPNFAFIANLTAEDGGAAIIAGNERVLRARFSDARHFWDLDRRTPLRARVHALDKITFHAKLGSQGDRVRRIESLAAYIAPLAGAGPGMAGAAAKLAKADLTTGMVGEFPELQGVMGGYYALHDGEGAIVAGAIRDHYAPRGPSDAVPEEPVAVTIALADKLDQLAAFFAIGEQPTGSGDPFGLRRAALGIIRIIRHNELRLPLRAALDHANAALAAQSLAQCDPAAVLDFLRERLFLQMRADGHRHDALRAVFDPAEDDLVRLTARFAALAALLESPDGADLLAGYKRASNILRIEDKKDGPHTGAPAPDLLRQTEEITLTAALDDTAPSVAKTIAAEDYPAAMARMATLRAPIDAFFDKVTVNATEPELRRNRLRLLARIRDTMNLAADFSRIEG
jgi:glycyl-tRNA synthetase beta chain